ncbi:hypothetical protein PROFUN_09388, partial [Planoprotostelium fungivorum]
YHHVKPTLKAVVVRSSEGFMEGEMSVSHGYVHCQSLMQDGQSPIILAVYHVPHTHGILLRFMKIPFSDLAQSLFERGWHRASVSLATILGRSVYPSNVFHQYCAVSYVKAPIQFRNHVKERVAKRNTYYLCRRGNCQSRPPFCRVVNVHLKRSLIYESYNWAVQYMKDFCEKQGYLPNCHTLHEGLSRTNSIQYKGRSSGTEHKWTT